MKPTKAQQHCLRIAARQGFIHAGLCARYGVRTDVMYRCEANGWLTRGLADDPGYRLTDEGRKALEK